MEKPSPASPRRNIRAYLVGGGIASLASAAYLLRDGELAGENIFIFDESQTVGGSLDGAGSAQTGYVIRGGRMFTDEAYTCTFDLLSFIPSLADPSVSVKEEVQEFNRALHSDSRARLVARGQKSDASQLGLTNKERLSLVELMAAPEAFVGAKKIDEMFMPPFFETNFWLMWSTTFAFQPWHSAVEFKRYLHRFIQEFPRLETLGGVRQTPYNQFDSIVRPLVRWLEEQQVHFVLGARVSDLDFHFGPHGKSVETIHWQLDGAAHQVSTRDGDLVLVTNGSMTAASNLGSMKVPALPNPSALQESWALWRNLAAKQNDFGRPETFFANPDASKWLSFTVTLNDHTFFDLMQAFSGNPAGTGGLVTFVESRWRLSIVLAHQPHFIGQPAEVDVFWGYGLFVDQVGNFVNKKMSDCTGEDILLELLGHLELLERRAEIVASANCIPCMMQFITSQFMPRHIGDRPQVCPPGTTDLAFIGQFCELPDDVVFTVEYSVGSAQTAVISLLGLSTHVSPLYKGQHDPVVVFGAMKALFN